MESIQHFLSVSILAGLFVFMGGLALGSAIYSVLPPGSVKEWLDENLVHKFRAGGLKLESFKENSLLLTLAVVLIYPVGDATLHILDDVFEDRLPYTCFEDAGQACKGQGIGCSIKRTSSCLEDGFAPVEATARYDDWATWQRYRSLSEGSKELKFTRIGEIEAREDEIDRETIDKEKSYLHDLEIFLLLFTMLSLALIIYAGKALAPRIVFLACALAGLVMLLVYDTREPVPVIIVAASAVLDLILLYFAVRSLVRWGRRHRGQVGVQLSLFRTYARRPEGDGAVKAPPPAGGPPDDHERLTHQLRRWAAGGRLSLTGMKERLGHPSVWKPLLACGSLAVLLSVIFFIREEYREQEDKYERLVYHVWKNHIAEKNKKEATESAKNAP